ncbi:MAG: single-stranded DNA-binding protein [Candidatus Methanomethylophilaceae archaeon]|nr:single-stranded DNA-binding protein [Candidatus Methanomethylophilaceae archaeon]
MNKEELTPHVEELKRVLEEKVTEKELMSELDKYVNEYGVDMESAKRAIRRKFGGEESGFVTGDAVSKKIGDLTGNEPNVDITAKIVYVERKQIHARGEDKTIVSGILGDDTGTASFTIWSDSYDLEKGLVYVFKNAYIKTWNDRIQVNMGNRGVVEKSDATIEMPERTISYTSVESKIKDLKEGMGNVSVTGRVLSVEERNVNVRGEDKTVYSGLMADDTGKVQFSAWNNHNLKEGETILITNAYIRGWKGIPQLNIGDRSEVSRVDDPFGNADLGTSSNKTLREIAESGGGLDVTVSGLVVDLRGGSGLIFRCPQCNRSVLGGECTNHGKIDPVHDLRMKIVLDDGSGAIGAVLNRELTEKLTGVTLENAVSLSKARGESGIIAREIAPKILMKRLVLRGNVMSDEYGPMMIVSEAETEEVDIEKAATKLLDMVEGAL